MNNNIIIHTKMDWTEFFSGSAAGAIVTEVGRYLREKSKRKVDISQNARDMAEITNSLFPLILEETLANRVVIYRATNSAGVIAPGKTLKVTAIYEDSREVNRLLEDIQDWKADSHYYQLFSNILTEGCTKIVTSELPVDCKLNTLNKAHLVKYSEIYHLTTTPDNAKVFYISIDSTIVDSFDTQSKYHIEIAINKLRNIFEKHKHHL